MEILQNIFQAEIIQRLGWTLVHFVWQATAIAMVLAIVLKLLHKSAANVRYITACMALVLIVLMPIVTIRMIDVSAGTIEPVKQAVVDLAKAGADAQAVVEMPLIESPPGQVAVAPRVPLKNRFIETVEPILPYVVVGWLVGVFGLSLWHLGGWRQLQRLRRQMVNQAAPALKAKLQQLSNMLGIQKAIEIMESALVQVPTVVGHLKPVILLPASVLTGLSPEQIEAILAHELAHIKRCDYLVNIMQTVVEILGFYHPAVWLVSHKIRVERENCCDDIAVSLCSDSLCYARALTTMEEIRGGQPALAVAASGGNLFSRIKRLLRKETSSNTSSWLPTAIIVLLLMSIAIPAALALSSRVNEKLDVNIEAPSESADINDTESIDASTRALGEAVKKRLTTYTDEEVFTLEDGQTAKMQVKENITNVAEILITPHIGANGTKFDLEGIDDSGKPIQGSKYTSPLIHDDMTMRMGLGKTFLVNGKRIMAKIQLIPQRQDDNSVVVEVKTLFTELASPKEIEAMLLTKGKDGQMQLDFQEISTSINQYRQQKGHYPEILEKLNRPLPEDVYSPSGKAYHYESSRKRFILSSCGEDGIYGNEDDEIEIIFRGGARSGQRYEIYPLEEIEDTYSQTEYTGQGRVRPKGNCSLGGKVVSAETGDPVDHTKVYLFYLGTHAPIFINVASDGSFVFEEIPTGPFFLRTINTAGYKDNIYNPENKSGSYPSFSLEENEQRSGIVFELEAACSISGKITDENGRLPPDIKTLTVVAWFEKEDGSGYKNKQVRVNRLDGSYFIDGLNRKPTYLMALNWRAAREGNAYPPIYYPGTFSRDEAELITFDDQWDAKNVDIQLRKTGGIVLEGTVTDERDEPVPQAFVVVHRRDMLFDFVTAYTDEQGIYQIQGLGDGEFLVHVDAVHRGFVRTRIPIDTDSSARKMQLDFALKQGVMISGKFVNEDSEDWQIGQSHGNANVTVQSELNSDPGECTTTSFSLTNFRNKYRPNDAQDSSGGEFYSGEGDYVGGNMIFPTKSSFILRGMMPGQTMISFSPKKEDQVVKKILYNGKNIMETGIETKPGEEIEDVTIVIGKAESLDETSIDNLKDEPIKRPAVQVEDFKRRLEEPVTVHINHSPKNDRLSVQYAVMAVCKAAGVPYNWDKSAELADPQRRGYIEPVNIEEKIASQAIADMVGPVGLVYDVDANGVYLYKPAVQVEGKQVSVETRFLLVDEAFLDDINRGVAKEAIGNQGSLDWRQFPVKLIDPFASSYTTGPGVGKAIAAPLNGFNINDQQADFIIRATQGHSGSKVLTAPKVVVFDNEPASIDVFRQRAYISSYTYTLPEGSQEPEPIIDKIDTGILCHIQPKIQPNGKYIDLSTNIEISTEVDTKKAMHQEKYPYEIPIIEKTHINTGFIVPDRGTVVLEGPIVTDKNDDNTTSKKKLLVLIKPTIAKPKSE